MAHAAATVSMLFVAGPVARFFCCSAARMTGFQDLAVPVVTSSDVSLQLLSASSYVSAIGKAVLYVITSALSIALQVCGVLSTSPTASVYQFGPG